MSVAVGNGPKLTTGARPELAEALAVAVGTLRVAPADGPTAGELDESGFDVVGTDGTGVGVSDCGGESRSPLAPKMAAATSSASITRLRAASGLTARGCR